MISFVYTGSINEFDKSRSDETLSLVFDLLPMKRMQISLCSHFHQTIQFSFKLFKEKHQAR